MASFVLGRKASAADYRLVGFDSIGSTNSEALAAARAGDPGKLWVASLEQTAGRGRRGRAWESPVGNLAASLLMRPVADPAALATLGFVAGVALRAALEAVMPGTRLRLGVDGADGTSGGVAARLALKWPNDVLADGAKLAGILLEAERLGEGAQAIVLGFGINVVAAPQGLPYPANSLRQLGVEATAEAVFAALAEAWVECYALWDEGRNLAAILALWRQAAAGIGAPVAVQQNGETIRGIFESVDDSGRLIVRSAEDRRLVITAGDVHFGATASAAP